MGYSLLRGLKVVELALLAPDGLGGILADLGADVVKLEQPPDGDYVRATSPAAVGSPTGPSLMHFALNRGKRSVAADLKQPAGLELARSLVREADVFIDGFRVGALERLGLGYEAVREINPRIVYASLSGFGRTGPYSQLPSHGLSFDSYAGLLAPDFDDAGDSRVPKSMTTVGIKAGPLYAAVGVLAALRRSQQTGEGCLIDVAQADAAVAWNSEAVERSLNDVHRRARYGANALYDSVRYSFYRTSDDRFVFFQAMEDRFFVRFCRAVGRDDLLERFPSQGAIDHAAGNDELRQELVAIFVTRTLDEWLQMFIDENVAGGPVLRAAELSESPQFQARGLEYASSPEVGDLRLVGCPVKVDDETFTATPAPDVGEHTDEVLADWLGVKPAIGGAR